MVAFSLSNIGVSSTMMPFLTKSQAQNLKSRLESDIQSLNRKYSIDLDKFIIIGNGSFILAERLSKAFFRRRQFVIGITGGSATQGSSWVNYLQLKLETEYQMSIEIRNAAQGSTSQVVTAPCINALVGDDIDLLFWEFAMNDAGSVELYPLQDNQSVLEQHPVRCMAAESWIREAINLNPGCLGFLHLWDIGIHTWNFRNNHSTPNLPWGSTNTMMSKYNKIYDSYFSVDVISMLLQLNLTDKKQFLRDDHHPNDYGYIVAFDLTFHAMLQTWLAGIKFPAFERLTRNMSSLKQQKPFSTNSNMEYVFPNEKFQSHCLMAMEPQFSRVSPIRSSVCQNQSNFEICNKIVLQGKVDKNRTDRKKMFLVESCSARNNTGGIIFDIFVPNPALLLLDCGLSATACKKFSMYYDSKLISHNTDLLRGQDIVSSFYHWIHKFEILNDAMRIINGTQKHNLRICGESEMTWGWHSQKYYTYDYATIARIVVMENKINDI